MMRLNRIHWLIQISQQSKRHPFYFHRGMWRLRQWFQRHGLVVIGDVGAGAYDVRITIKGRASLVAAIAEYEHRRGGLVPREKRQ